MNEAERVERDEREEDEDEEERDRGEAREIAKREWRETVGPDLSRLRFENFGRCTSLLHRFLDTPARHSANRQKHPSYIWTRFFHSGHSRAREQLERASMDLRRGQKSGGGAIFRSPSPQRFSFLFIPRYPFLPSRSSSLLLLCPPIISLSARLFLTKFGRSRTRRTGNVRKKEEKKTWDASISWDTPLMGL